ncbi:aldo/keto reductase [Formicincola oecophyllae]|uniref:Aldo/keto reductase n=1 Tax=Formicincola oecophyllae TaxID=2558361 RepID=A0A4Y6UBV3_9PROT|nr:aldo/keto reductase [Formicincola oecophyllae]QDH13595.1 aldo/keto reductase [Formicincola oecophyllae]
MTATSPHLYRSLGASALEVSTLCLGSMMFGGPCDEATALRIMDDAHARGFNFLDTADVYQQGRTEEVVGKGIAKHRDDWIVATKFGFSGASMGFAGAQRPNREGQSRKWILQTFERSLKRMATDYVDILYFHRALPGVTLEEGLRTVNDLMAQGKVLYYGLSNFRGWEIADVVRLADRMNMTRPIVSQPLYNITDRTAEQEILPAGAHYGLGAVPYSPLARGVLTGKYAPNQQPAPGSRAGRADKRMMETEWRAESLELAQKIKAHAESRGTTAVGFALAWILANPAVSSVLAGPRTFEQWQGYQAGLDYTITPDDEVFINSLVSPGHSSRPGYSDPGYPVRGRAMTIARPL